MENDPKAFVFWLQGFFELSGATILNEQQVRVIKEHLALVLTKTTPSTVQPYVPVPIYPSNPMPSDKGWEITCTTTDKLYPIGPKCVGCNKVCSEEGGTCKKCRAVTTTSKIDAEKIYCKYIDPFENPMESPKETTNEIADVICALTC